MECWNVVSLIRILFLFNAKAGHQSKTHCSIFPASQYSIGAKPLNTDQEVKENG